MTRNEKTHLENTRERLSQIRARERATINHGKSYQHKAETHRLIKNGALAEKYLGCEGMEPREFVKVLKRLVKTK